MQQRIALRRQQLLQEALRQQALQGTQRPKGLTEYQRKLLARQRVIQKRLEQKRQRSAGTESENPSANEPIEFANSAGAADAESSATECVAARPFLFRSGDAEPRQLAEKPPR